MFPYTSGDLHLGHWWNFALADMHVALQAHAGLQTSCFRLASTPSACPPRAPPSAAAAHPYHVDDGQHPPHGTPVADDGRRVRLVQGARHLPARVLPLEPVVLPAVLQARPGLSAQGAGQLVPEPRRAGQRAGPQRPLLAVRCAGRRSATSSSGSSASPSYADDLLDFSEIEWPERIKAMQTNWIGRSEGVEFDLTVDEPARTRRSRVFTTRVDTVFGMTYVVLAPEHPLVAAADHAGSAGRGRGATSTRRGGRRRSSACRPSGRRRASSSAATRSTRPTASGCRSGSPTTCWRSTALAPSWPCPPPTSVTGSSRARSICRFAWSCGRRTRQTT